MRVGVRDADRAPRNPFFLAKGCPGVGVRDAERRRATHFETCKGTPILRRATPAPQDDRPTLAIRPGVWFPERTESAALFMPFRNALSSLGGLPRSETGAVCIAFRKAFRWLARVRRVCAAIPARPRTTIVRSRYRTAPDEHPCLARNFLPHPKSGAADDLRSKSSVPRGWHAARPGKQVGTAGCAG